MIGIGVVPLTEETSSTSTGGGGGGTYNVNVTKTGVEGVYIWGHYHDHTQNIDGDLDQVGNINAKGTVNATTVKATKEVTAPSGVFENLTASAATIQDILTDRISSRYIDNRGTIRTTDLEALRAVIGSIIAKDINVDNLTAKTARFFKLVIDEVKSVYGIQIQTVGNAELDHVGHINNSTYRCFFKASDNGRAITNVFEPNDQVICHTLNFTAPGQYENAHNKFYWMLCTSTGTTDYCTFEDSDVNDILVYYADNDHDDLISAEECYAINNPHTWFSGSTIDTFNEFAAFSGVTGIDSLSFANSTIREIELPESLRTIGAAAFSGCTNLQELTLPTQLSSIADNAFFGCSKLTNIVILRGTVGNNCFGGCSALEYLQLGEGQLDLDKDIIGSLPELSTIVIPSTVSAFTSDAFEECQNLETIYMKPTTPPVVSGTSYLPRSLNVMYVPRASYNAYSGSTYWGQYNVQPYDFEAIGTASQTPLTAITETLHHFDLTTTDKDADSNGVPEKYDEVAVLGNRTDEDRQNAITIGAYSSAYLDPTVLAPFICQYQGINDYDLASHRVNVISPSKNEFYGKFTVIVEGHEIPLDEFIAEMSGSGEIITDSDYVTLFVDSEQMIDSLECAQGLPNWVKLKVGSNEIPTTSWTEVTVKYNGNDIKLI